MFIAITFSFKNKLFKLFISLEYKYNNLLFAIRISSIEVIKQKLHISTSLMSTEILTAKIFTQE